MATNSVSLIMQFLTPDIIARIAATLGLGRTETQAGVSAAVPALLAAFCGVADKPGGSQILADAIKNQSGVLDNVIKMVGGGSPSSLVERGSNMLASLLGSHDQSALAGAVGKFAGTGQSTGSSLIGMLGPIVMGVIGKQIGSRSLDAGSVSGLLASQKEQIAQALPQGFGRLLGDTGIFELARWRGRNGCCGRKSGRQSGKRGGRTGRAVWVIRQPLSWIRRPSGPCCGIRHAKLDLLGNSRPRGWRTSLLSVRKGHRASCPTDNAVAANEASDRWHGAQGPSDTADGATRSERRGRRRRYWKAAR